MAFPTNLTTNEVKNSAGAEVEFNRLGPLSSNPRSMEFSAVGEQPAYPNRLYAAHQIIGVGVALRRRSVTGFNFSFPGQVDTARIETLRVYTVADVPQGNMTALTYLTTLMAYQNSWMASLGASTTILYDGTGNGSAALINGSL